MEFFGLESYILWFIAAVILISYELVIGFSAIFLFLLGVSALCVGFLSHAEYIDPNNLSAQFIIFLTLFVMFFILLWKPIRKALYKKSGKTYQNIIGQKAEVISAKITKKKFGKIKWSGTEVKAKLHKDCDEDYATLGDSVEVVEIKDNTFIVKIVN